MIVTLTIVLIFHTLVLTETIPYAIVWAGKINSVRDMRKLELISICINSFSILIFLLKAKYIKNKVPGKILNAIILLLAVIFSLNTIGNLFAKSQFELFFFTPITFISAILCLRILFSDNKNILDNNDSLNTFEHLEK